jgi:hypothetical protein
VVSLLEALGLVVSDPEVGSGELGVLTFQIRELVDEFVEFEVGDLRGVLLTIQLLVALDGGAEAEYLFARGFRHGRQGRIKGERRGGEGLDTEG